MKRPHVFVLYGMLWILMGFFLLTLGLRFLTVSVYMDTGAYIHKLAQRFSMPSSKVAMFITVFSVVIGFLKGRFILYKTAKRNIARVAKEKGVVPFKKVFPLSFVALVMVMMSLGLLMRVSHVPLDVRGAVDIAVGSALIIGGMIYFLFARAETKSVDTL